VDPDGMESEESDWIPKVNKDGSVSYVAEEGDNYKTFAKQYGLDENIAKMIVPDNIKAGEVVSGTAVKHLTNDKSEILKLDLNFDIFQTYYHMYL